MLFTSSSQPQTESILLVKFNSDRSLKTLHIKNCPRDPQTCHHNWEIFTMATFAIKQPFTYLMSCAFPREDSCLYTTCFLHASGLVGKENIQVMVMMAMLLMKMIMMMVMMMMMMMHDAAAAAAADDGNAAADDDDDDDDGKDDGRDDSDGKDDGNDDGDGDDDE